MVVQPRQYAIKTNEVFDTHSSMCFESRLGDIVGDPTMQIPRLRCLGPSRWLRYGRQMFKIARKALEDMAQIATEYKKYVKDKDKFCHAFGIFQYDIHLWLVPKPDGFVEKPLDRAHHQSPECRPHTIAILQSGFCRSYGLDPIPHTFLGEQSPS